MGNQEIANLIKIWQEFATDKIFRLNPDPKKVGLLAQGVLNNEKNHSLKFCPCRMRTGNNEADFKLICPCNFFIQKTWLEKGECWCGLYVKK